MAWLSRNNYVPTDKVHSEMFNSLANDDRQWGGNVNGGGYTLSNVVIAGLLTDPTQAKGDLIVRGGSGLTRLQVGLQGQVLTVDDQTPTGLKWITGAGGGGGIPPNDTTTQRIRVSRIGALVGTRHEINFVPGANVAINVAEEPENNRISVGIASTGGGGGMVDPTDARGDLIVRGANPPVTKLPVGANGFVLTADSAASLGVKWAALPSTGFVDPTTDKGDLIARGSSAPATKLPVGANGFVLTADTNAPLGVKWAAAVGGVPPSRVLSAGYGLDPTSGGDLSADRSFSVLDEGSVQKIRVSLSGTVRGTQPEINFVAGSGINISVNNDSGGKKVDVSFVNTGGGGGGGGGIPDVLEQPGDLVVQGPSEITRLPIGTGTHGYVLTVDTADPLQMRWQPPAVGGQNQTPWLSNIDGGGFTLSNARIIANHPLAVVADAGGNLTMAMQTQGGLNRWALGKTNDANSDFFLARYSDAGSFLDSPLYIERATGNVAFSHALDVAGAISTSGNLNSGGTVNASSVNVTGNYLINGAPINAAMQSPWVTNIDGAGFTLNNARLTQIKSTVVGAVYTNAAIEIRETNLVSTTQTGLEYSPRIGFHWGGVTASQIGMDSSGRIRTMNWDASACVPFACGPDVSVYGVHARLQVMNSAGNQNYFFGINEGDANKLYISAGSGPAQGLAPAIVVSGYPSNVGIGLTNVSYKFQVNGGRCHFAAASEPYALMLAYNAATNGMWLGGENNGDFLIASGGGTACVRVLQTGEVGIGQIMPLGVLHCDLYQKWAVFASNVAATLPPNINGVFLGWNYSGGGAEACLAFNGGTAGLVIADTTGSIWRQRVIITAAGQVGINQPNPGGSLHGHLGPGVDAPGGSVVLSRHWNGTSDTRASAIFHYYSSSAGADLLAFAVAGDGGALGAPVQLSQIKMTLSTAGRLTVSGDVNITGAYRVNGTAINTGGGINLYGNNTLYGFATSINFYNGNSNTAAVSFASGAGGVSFNYVSDIRIKRNVTDLEGGLAVIERLRPVSFEHTGALGHRAGKKNVSIVTQELREILPDCVYPIKQKLFPEDEEETELLAYDPQHILYHLVLAVKQLKKKLGEKS